MRRAGVYPIWLLVLIPALSPLTYYLLFTQPTGTAASSPPVKAMADAMLRHSYYDASFQVVNQIWTSPQQKPCDELCQFLLTQTNLPPSATVVPPEVNLVDQLSPARSHTMRLNPDWVAAISVHGEAVWPAKAQP